MPLLVHPLHYLNLRYVDPQGVQRVSGGSDLKASQYYPKLFGHAVAQAYERHASTIKKEVKQRAPPGFNRAPIGKK